MRFDFFRPQPELPINPVPVDMRFIAAGSFLMGSDDHYPEEAPVRPVVVDPFWIDTTPVTNVEFEAFVDATGYVTTAERDLPRSAHQLDDGPRVRGSMVFHAPGPEMDLRLWGAWWRQVEGADWRHPQGPDSGLDGRMEHPVVHVSHEDAQAYAAWAHKSLPTEAEWEFAARGGLESAEFAWGDKLAPRGRQMANIWQGAFPYENLLEDGYSGTSPVRAFPPNGHGVYDMIGNVWEWTDDSWIDPFAPDGNGAGSDAALERRVLKGGSHLCARSLNHRYRPAARQPGLITRTTGDIGFRCVYRP